MRNPHILCGQTRIGRRRYKMVVGNDHPEG
jgi:hypothetical protein